MSAFKKKASSGGGEDFEKPPAGAHAAVMVALVDLGTHIDTYQGKQTENEKLFLAWELTGEKDSNGDNFVIGNAYTNSLSEKANLRKIIEAWRGKKMGEDEEFDFTKLAGKSCLLTVVHATNKDGTKSYANIHSIGALPKTMGCPPASRKPFIWQMGDDINAFPEWLPRFYGQLVRDKVQQSQEMKGGVAVGAGDASEGSDQEAF